MRAARTTTHIDVVDVDVTFHCEQDDGEASYRITPLHDTVQVYLTGTPEQLGAFADAIVRAVGQHVRDQFAAYAREALR